MDKIPPLAKTQIFIVNLWIEWLNFWLKFFQKVLFRKLKSTPRNILIYKIGNIGDIVCAIPAIIAVRRFYPSSKITLLTSPGEKGALGAKELLTDAWYLDELKVYYIDDLGSSGKKIKFAGDLKKNNYDLFIQFPDDLANFRTLLRNLFFAKIIGAKSSFGFKIRTIQLFKKTQVDYIFQKTEVESLLELINENSIKSDKIEFDFNISVEQKNKVKNLLEEKWGKLNKKIPVVAISPGGKRETNQWPIERFKEIAKHLEGKYNAKIIIVGGAADNEKANNIRKELKEETILIAAGKLEILETLELLKHCAFLISNSTGTIHMAAAVGSPTIGIYGVRDVFGRWFPHGKNHKILYHNFLDCDYRKEKCIEKSIDMVSVKEVIAACDEVISLIII